MLIRWQTTVLGITIFLLLSACGSSLTRPGATISPTADSVHSWVTPTFVSNSEQETKQPVPSITPIASSESIKEDQLCPVTNSTLKLKPNERLILKPAEGSTGGFWLLDSIDQDPKLIPGTVPPASQIYRFQDISPDGRWIAFLSWKNEEQMDASLRIAAVDGSVQKEILTVSRESIAWWHTDQSIVINTNPQNDLPPYSIIVVDPFGDQIAYLTRSARGYSYSDYSVFGGEAYATLFDGQWKLYHYDSESEEVILQWLAEEEWIYQDELTRLSSLKIRIYEEGSSLLADVIVKKPYGFDFAFGVGILPETPNLSYQDVMTQHILLPEPNLEAGLWQGITPSVYLLERYDPTGDSLINPNPRMLYALDFANQTLIDYCLDRKASYPPIASISREFLAWTVYDPPGSSGQITGIEILNLMTGERTRYLGGWDLLGWVIVD